MPIMRTPTKRKGQGIQRISDDDFTPNKRRCSDRADGVLDDSQAFVQAVMSASTVTVQADVHNEDDTLSQLLQPSPESECSKQLFGLISKLSSDMHRMFANVNEKMDKMASDIEKRLTNKFSQMLDKRINSEIGKIKKEVRKEVGMVKDDIREDIRCLQSQIDERPTGPVSTDLNLVIRNLSETEGEDLQKKVEGLLRDGLKLRNTGFTAVVRKSSRGNRRPGVVIMTCRSQDEKDEIMKSKKILKESRAYRDVFVHPDQSFDSRLQASNFKTLVSALQSEVPGLRLQGTRLVHDRDQHHRRGNHGDRNDRYERSDRTGVAGERDRNQLPRDQGRRAYQKGDNSGRQHNSGAGQSGSQGDRRRDWRRDGHSRFS